AVIAIVSDQQPDFQKAAAGVEKSVDAFASSQLACPMLFFGARRPTAGAQASFERSQLLDQVAHVCGARELRVGGHAKFRIQEFCTAPSGRGSVTLIIGTTPHTEPRPEGADTNQALRAMMRAASVSE